MKMLVLILVLVSAPMVSQAGGWGDFENHRYANRRGDLSFWHDVSDRQARQDFRIDRGVHKGQLTRHEARKLYRKQNKLARRIHRLKKYGHLSYAKKRKIMGKLDKLSEQIRKLKHNDRYAYVKHAPRRHSYQTRDSRYDGNHGYISSANSDYSAGIYFRF